MRCWYQDYRKRVPPSHPQLRAKHFERKLSTLTQRMVQSCEQSSTQAQSLLDQSDANMSAAREAMKLCDLELMAGAGSLDWEAVREKASQYVNTSECPVCLYPLINQPHPQPHPSHQSPLKSSRPHPICTPSSSELPTSKSLAPQNRPRPLSVLSCGHVLHEVCIEAMERFCSADTMHMCPLCRTPYQRTLW